MRTCRYNLLAAIALTFASSQVFAACDLPASPIIPDGNVASLDELVSAQQAMKTYQGALGDYRDCLKVMEEEMDAHADDAEEQKSNIIANYNSSVDSEALIADEFNVAVRNYKARQPAEAAE